MAEETRRHFIYKYEFPNGRWYVGKSVDIERRNRQHRSAAFRALKKHGKTDQEDLFALVWTGDCQLVDAAIVKFDIAAPEQLDSCETPDGALALEAHHIDKRYNRDFVSGYNIDKGGWYYEKLPLLCELYPEWHFFADSADESRLYKIPAEKYSETVLRWNAYPDAKRREIPLDSMIKDSAFLVAVA